MRGAQDGPRGSERFVSAGRNSRGWPTPLGMPRTAILSAALVLAAALSPAAAAGAPARVPSGGTEADGADRPRAVPDAGGGVRAGRPQRRPAEEAPTTGGRGGRRPILTEFSVGPRSTYLYGTPATVAFRIAARSRTVRVGLEVFAAGERRPVRRLDLGERRSGVRQTFALTGREGGPFPEGKLRVRITARDARGRALVPSARASAVEELGFHWHRFPLVGRYVYALGAGRFGAPRPGHAHQGQDLSAPMGTPIVAPRGGTVEIVAYQAGGAGNYVVLDGDGEDADYVFMHLQTGSTVVRKGQQVLTGQRLGNVGSTGHSTGPHLHFEIWRGGWFAGGRPVDPLPHLRSWDRWS